MKRLLAIISSVCAVSVFAIKGPVLGHAAIFALLAFGGPAAIFIGVGGLILEFIFGFLLQSGLSQTGFLIGL